MNIPTIPETELFDGFDVRVAVKLEDVLEFIRHIFPDLDASVLCEEVGECGYEHYVLIRGECADIKLKKDYGGIYCPDDFLVCTVLPHLVYDRNTGRIDHVFRFKEGFEPEVLEIRSDYAKNIRDYINSAAKYLKNDPAIFHRSSSL